jgi:tetratricopeptide (TPR) repeat protein
MHACLALEVALAGESSWNGVSTLLCAAEGAAFRQQMAALLDLLNLAGLPSEDPVLQRRCLDELRSARQAGLAAVENLEGLQLEARAHCQNGNAKGQESGEAERQALVELAAELRQAGFSQLADLVVLPLPWGESLFLKLVDFFLRRALRGDPALSTKFLEPADDNSGPPWRCLEMIARLLDDRAAAVETVLNNPNQTPPARALVEDRTAERFFQQGVDRYRRGDYPLAAAHFTAALKLDPTDARLYAHRGDAYRMQGEYERAIADFETAVRLNPANPSTLISRANAYLKTGEHDRVVADCSAALEGSPNNAWAHRIRAAGYAQLGSLDLAIADLTAAIALAPGDEDAYYQRGLLNLRLRACARAVEDFTRVLELNPDCISACEQRGDAHRLLKNYPAAIRDYSELLRCHASNVQAYASRGSAYRLKGDFERALADYEQALLLEPGNARVRCSLGILFRKMGDLERARIQLDEAIRLDPENWAALYHSGKIFLLQGHCDKALVDLTKALSFNARMSAAYISRALIHDWLGQWQDALADSTQALALDANCPAARLVRGTVYRHMGQHAAAMSDLTEAIGLDSHLAPAYQERSMVYVLQGEYQSALTDCKQFVDLEPGNAQAYFQRSLVYRLLNDIENSLLDYHRALQLDPRCLMIACDRAQAESARLRTAQRLADHIDGTRHEPLAVPPPDAFHIVFKPRPSAGSGSSREPAVAEPETSSAQNQTANRNTVAAGLAGQGQAKSKRVARHQRVASPPDLALSASDESFSNATKLEDDEEEEEFALLLAGCVNVPAVSEISPSASDGSTCQTTKRSSRVDEKGLEEERAADTDSVLAVGTTAPSSPVALRSSLNRPVWNANSNLSKVKRNVQKEQRAFLAGWNKGRLLGAGGLVTLALIGLGFWFNRSDQVRVYPAHGQAFLDGKPIPNASIRLDPVWTKNPAFPRPRAIVDQDGSFVLETYGEEDGAPVGEYKVSVQLLVKTGKKDESEGGELPRNILPAKYGNFETSGLRLQIQEGANALPALELKHSTSGATPRSRFSLPTKSKSELDP